MLRSEKIYIIRSISLFIYFVLCNHTLAYKYPLTDELPLTHGTSVSSYDDGWNPWIRNGRDRTCIGPNCVDKYPGYAIRNDLISEIFKCFTARNLFECLRKVSSYYQREELTKPVLLSSGLSPNECCECENPLFQMCCPCKDKGNYYNLNDEYPIHATRKGLPISGGAEGFEKDIVLPARTRVDKEPAGHIEVTLSKIPSTFRRSAILREQEKQQYLRENPFLPMPEIDNLRVMRPLPLDYRFEQRSPNLIERIGRSRGIIPPPIGQPPPIFDDADSIFIPGFPPRDNSFYTY